MGMTDVPEKARRRWHRPAPDRCVVALLALEGLLLLSAWFRWFPFNQHKGYTVLITIASVGLALLLMLLWFLAALVFRWQFQFSILSLLLLVVVVAAPCSWLATAMKQARKQQEVVEEIETLGKTGYFWPEPFNGHRFGPEPPPVVYDWMTDEASNWRPNARPPAPAWLRKRLGDDFFTDVVSVTLDYSAITDAQLKHLEGLTRLRELRTCQLTDAGLGQLEGLTQLRVLGLTGTAVSDAGLQYLRGLTELQRLYLGGTNVTDKGVQDLQKALPKAKIVTRWPRSED